MALSNKILITGANGFLGAQLAQSLAQKDYQVIAAMRDKSKAVNLYHKNISIVQTDYSNDLDKIIDNVDTIIHTAALLSSNFKSRKSDYFKINVNLTKNLLEKCINSKLKRFIFISSVGVYGETRNECADENSSMGEKLSYYEQSKYEAEKVCEYFFDRVSIIVLRLSQLYGPTMKYGWPEVFKQIKNNKFYLLGRAQGTIQPLYVDDVVEGIESVVKGNGRDGQIYNMAGKEIIALNELFAQMASILKVKPIKRLPYLPVFALSHLLKLIPSFLKTNKLNLITPHNVAFFKTKRCYKIDKAKKELGFDPRVGIKEGLEKTINDFI